MATKVKSVAGTAGKTKFVYPITTDVEEGDDSSSVTITNINKKVVFRMDVSVDGTPFCCGLKELGGFSSSLEDGTKLSRERQLEAVKQLFEEIVDAHEGSTLLFTLVPEGGNEEDEETNKLIGEALADGELFTMVKEFRNSNSGNTNYLYISNNKDDDNE